MGKTRDLVKKIRDTKGTFHAKMGTIKDRNGMGLTEAEDIKPPKPESASFLLVLLPKPLSLRGALPHYLSLKKELAYSSS